MSKYEQSLKRTLSLRKKVPADLRPLFDHCVHLAKDAHSRGSFKRAGMDLRYARKLAGYRGKR